MKYLKLASIAITCLVMGSFTKKPSFAVTYYYLMQTEYQRLQPGNTTQSLLCQNTIRSNYFTDVENWMTITQSFEPTSDYSKYIGSITFAEEFDADGGSDGQLTLQEALNAVWNNYISSNPDSMSPSYIVDGFAIVNVTAATACH